MPVSSTSTMAAPAPQGGNETPRNSHLDQPMSTSTSSGGSPSPTGNSGHVSDSANLASSARFGAAAGAFVGGPEHSLATSTSPAAHVQQDSPEEPSTDSPNLASRSLCLWSTQVARELISGIDNHEVTEPLTRAIGSVLPVMTSVRYVTWLSHLHCLALACILCVKHIC